MLYWFSLASHTQGFLGAVIVEADSPSDGLTKVREIAPEAVSNACDIRGWATAGIDPKYHNRLIVKPEILEVGESTRGATH